MYLHITYTCTHVNRHVHTILHMHIPKYTHAQKHKCTIHTQTNTYKHISRHDIQTNIHMYT